MWRCGSSRSGVKEIISCYKLELQWLGAAREKKNGIWFDCIISVCDINLGRVGCGKANELLLQEIILCCNPRCRQGFTGNIMYSLSQEKGCQESKEKEEPAEREVIRRTWCVSSAKMKSKGSDGSSQVPKKKHQIGQRTSCIIGWKHKHYLDNKLV